MHLTRLCKWEKKEFSYARFSHDAVKRRVRFLRVSAIPNEPFLYQQLSSLVHCDADKDNEEMRKLCVNVYGIVAV